MHTRNKATPTRTTSISKELGAAVGGTKPTHSNYMYILHSAMHNIIASEQSGVECACMCALHVVQNCIVAYVFRITYNITVHMCSARIEIYRKISPFRRLGQLARNNAAHL